MIQYKGKLPEVYFSHTTGFPSKFDPGAATAVGEPIAVGDWILAIITSKGNFAATSKVKLPEGWKWILPQTAPGTGTTTVGIAAHRRAAGETIYEFSGAALGAETIGVFLTLVWGSGGADPDTWITGPTWARLGVDTLLVRSPAIKTQHNGSTVLAIAADRTIAAETEAQVNVRAGWADFMFIKNDDQSMNFAVRDFSAAGEDTGEVITDFPNVHAQNGLGFQMEIPPANPVTAPQTGFKLRRKTDAGFIDGRLKIVGADGSLITPKGGKALKRGYPSVTAMMNTPSFRIAHRGGSREFPELSLHAFTQSALLGFGAMEFSLARTSDGVWFGLHDETFQRTSGDPRKASEMTWAQVQALKVYVPPNSSGQTPKPYLRWEELMEKYYDSHVLFLDPKYANTQAFRQELYSKMLALPGTPQDRLVGKYYGVHGSRSPNGFSLPEELAVRGFKSWGYFYESDAPNFADFQGRWSMLGMEYTATQETWNSIKSFGKKVIGHIVPGVAEAQTAISKGADGLMVAGVKTVPARL